MVEQRSVSADRVRSELLKEFGDRLEFNKELAPMTSYRTGGRATYFISVGSAEELSLIVAKARQLEIDHFLMGGGSNILVSDDGFDGLIVKVDVQGIRLIAEEESIDVAEIECGAGEELMSLVTFAAENSLTGLEFATGIWGSVGGAIYGNAGAFGGDIGSITTRVMLVDSEGNINNVGPDYCRFGYRDSYLKTTHEVVVKARFRVRQGDKEKIQARIDEITAQRNSRHPNDGMSAGCFFKNIPDKKEPHGKLPAGRLLEQAGAKGMAVGGARVYDKHANIIVNTGTATSKDIRNLADILKQKVYDRFGILLEEEVQLVGKF